MQLIKISLLLSAVFCFSCNAGNNKKQEQVQKENDSLKKEIEVIKNEGQKDIIKQTDTVLKNDTQEAVTQNPLIRTGNHNLTLQWISWDQPGTVTISDMGNSTYTIVGGQLSKTNKDYININGIIKVVSKNELQFEGSITSFIADNDNGKVCEKKGKYVFKATGTRKYWRLQQMASCGGETVDYVDIYF